MKPLLLCNTVEYRGTEVPTFGLEGVVVVEGLHDGDVVRIHHNGTCTDVIEDGMYGPFKVPTLRAERLRSSGAEVAAWVA